MNHFVIFNGETIQISHRHRFPIKTSAILSSFSTFDSIIIIQLGVLKIQCHRAPLDGVGMGVESLIRAYFPPNIRSPYSKSSLFFSRGERENREPERERHIEREREVEEGGGGGR